MKKIGLLLFISFFLTSIYAYDFSLTGVKNEKNEVNIYRGKSIQTISDSNFLISMLAEKNDHGIQFSTSITNYSGDNYFFDENCISVYQGNVDENNWTKIEYIPASIFFKNEKRGARINEIFSAIALGLSAAGAGYSTINGSGYVNGYRYNYTARVYSPAEAAIATTNSYIALDNLQQRNQDYLTFLENNLLYSSQIPASDNYNGIFFVDEKKGPDYKVVMEFSPTEVFEFFFTRSDKDEILNPWKDKSHSRHSVIAGVSPMLNHFSAYYLWSQPKGVGFYGGMSFQEDSIGLNTFGDISFGTFENPEPIGFGYPDPLHKGYTTFYDWKFNYDKSSYKYDSYGISGGVTIKTFPNTWLLIGIGIDFVLKEYYEGDLYYKYNGDYKNPASSWTFYNHCWLEDYSVARKFAPQIGVNFITNHLDIGAMFTYPITGKLNFDIMIGYAF